MSIDILYVLINSGNINNLILLLICHIRVVGCKFPVLF